MSEVFGVRSPGLLTTIQDLGRPNAVASGVPPGGAMDRFAHIAANLICGNDRAAATLECTLRGPQLTALNDCAVAITGADLDPRVNGEQVPMWTAVRLRAGDELSFAGRRIGSRAYIAVAGGIAGDRWLGSLSTSLLAQRGGMRGRALVAGDVITSAGDLAEYETRQLAPHLLPDYSDRTLRAIPGPHVDRLADESRVLLFGSPFSVSPNSDRMGYRLEGQTLEASGEELLSFGLVPGVLQVPGSGNPILLMADHQTAGGYPVAAVVISASMTVAAQMAPGDELRFEEVSIETALELRANQRAALDSISSLIH